MIQTSLDTGAFDIDGDLTGSFGTVPGTDSEGAAQFLDVAKAGGVDGAGPFRGESYDAAALMILAMQAAGSTDRAALAANVMAVANAPGEKIMPGELAMGLKILASGGEVDYVGASNVEFTGVGEASGSYKELEIGNKQFNTVRFH